MDLQTLCSVWIEPLRCLSKLADGRCSWLLSHLARSARCDDDFFRFLAPFFGISPQSDIIEIWQGKAPFSIGSAEALYLYCRFTYIVREVHSVRERDTERERERRE